MTAKKFFFIMLTVFMLSIGGGVTMLYLANKALKNRSADVVNLKLENATLEAQLAAYQTAKKDVEKYAYLNQILTSALPQDKDQARTVREIFALAQQSGITIKSVQFTNSTLGTKTGSSTTPASSGASSTPSTATTTVTQAKPVSGLKGVYGVETTIIPYSDGKVYKVSYAQLIDFLQRIESNRRAMQVSSLQLTPLGQTESDSISFTLVLNIFIKP